MDARELLCIAHSIDSNFQGVFARDEIPRKRKSLIFNTDPRGKPGSHWQCIYEGEFFCSYALPKPFKSLKIAIEQPIQSSHTSTCGIHCLYFLYCRKYSLPLKYTEDCLKNDLFVTKWFSKKYKLSINMFDDDLIRNQICTEYLPRTYDYL